MTAQSASAPRPSFGQSIVLGLVASASGAAILAALTPVVGFGGALRSTIALLALAYILYLVRMSGERVGRITTIALWTVAAAAAWLTDLPLAAYALAHIGLVWLVRSLYYHSGVLPALADLGVAVLGAAFAAWAAERSGSAWLALWCFFLGQAFFVLIPESLAARAAARGDACDDTFDRAHRAAEAAVRRLSSAL